MKLRIFITCLAAILVTAVRAQDFASRYMTENEGDSTLTCISVSPKMMEEILESKVGRNDTTGVADIISRLKSMQVVFSNEEGDAHFERAESMAVRHSARFREVASYDEDGKDRARIYVREQSGEHIVELVLLRQQEGRFTVIDFTGDMDSGFIDRLTHTMLPVAGGAEPASAETPDDALRED